MDVLLETKDLLAFSKPAGLPTLSKEASEESLQSYIQNAFPELARELGLERDSGILHRLDNLTTGIVCVAKTAEVHEFYRSIWKTERVKKIYRAIVFSKEGKELPTTIDFPIGHSAKSKKKMVCRRPGSHWVIRGEWQDARTVILSSRELAGDRREVEVQIGTGVRHQIRCHLSALGWPIVGDPIYSLEKDSKRLFLHSWKCELPVRGQTAPLEILCSLPSDWPPTNN